MPTDYSSNAIVLLDGGPEEVCDWVRAAAADASAHDLRSEFALSDDFVPVLDPCLLERGRRLDLLRKLERHAGNPECDEGCYVCAIRAAFVAG